MLQRVQRDGNERARGLLTGGWTMGAELGAAGGIPPRIWQLDAASISDANKGLRILPRELRPYRRGMRMVGRAVTVAASADLVPVLAGLDQCGPGEILVVDAGTTEQAVLGELFASEAVRRGMAGIVVYGLCRDTATLTQLPLPIYSLGTVPCAPGATRLPAVSADGSADAGVRMLAGEPARRAGPADGAWPRRAAPVGDRVRPTP